MFTDLIALFQGRYGMAIHLLLPWVAFVIVLRFPRDFTVFMHLGAWVNREGSTLSATFLWLFGPVYLGFSPAFGAFVPSWLEFLRPALYIGGVLFIATAATGLITTPGWKYGFIFRFIPLLLASLLYGYEAARELDVMFDRSPDVVYVSKVSHKNAVSGSRGLTVMPWGPVTVRRNVPVPYSVYRSVRLDDPICMVLRQGALGVPWDTAQPCPWKGGRTDVGP